MRYYFKLSAIAFALLITLGCTSVPLDTPKETTIAIADTSGTQGASKVAAWLDGRTDVNGFYPLSEGFDAFGVRLALMTNADASIDAQYFLMKPDDAGLVFAGKLLAAADRGVRVRIVILTNGLATNNHTAVFSSYKTYRKDMLRAGVELWEARADAAKVTDPDGNVGLEHLTLHTKGMMIDRKRIFVGSLNLDPRSVDINTEMGLLIESPEMAELLTNSAIRRIPTTAYQLKLDDNDKISWHAMIDGQEVVETKEPQTSAWRRFSAWFLKIAPEKQL